MTDLSELCRLCRTKENVQIFVKEVAEDLTVFQGFLLASEFLPKKMCLLCYSELLRLEKFCTTAHGSALKFSEEYRGFVKERTEKLIQVTLDAASIPSSVAPITYEIISDFKQEEISIVSTLEVDQEVLEVPAPSPVPPPNEEIPIEIMSIGSIQLGPIVGRSNSVDMPSEDHNEGLMLEENDDGLLEGEIIRNTLNLTCDQCLRTFATRDERFDHEMSVHLFTQVNCTFCCKSFSSYDFLASHINRAHPPRDPNLPIETIELADSDDEVACPPRVKRQREVSKVPKKSKFQCVSCKKSFDSQKGMKIHSKRHCSGL